jgi:hypothetical protein
MNNKIIAGAVVGAVVFAGAGFYGGMSYAKGQMPMRLPGQGGGFAGANGAQFAGRGGAGARGGTAGGFVAGQVLSQNAGSVTIKMMDGSTKIVLIGTSTQIAKQTVGAASDLAAGTNVVVTGSQNSDGSITGAMIQIRPAGATEPGAPAR